jgi:hypothetical protein
LSPYRILIDDLVEVLPEGEDGGAWEADDDFTEFVLRGRVRRRVGETELRVLAVFSTPGLMPRCEPGEVLHLQGIAEPLGGEGSAGLAALRLPGTVVVRDPDATVCRPMQLLDLALTNFLAGPQSLLSEGPL